ncbi:MAG: MOSC domain-containing protein [Candidatus Bipolaricaulia bacterium]
MSEGKVVAICISEAKGTPKRPIPSGKLVREWGLEGDAHAGDWHRQVSLLAIESIEKMLALGVDVEPGSFAENITTKGVELVSLPIGTRMQIGGALLEITQIGKVCHDHCAVFEQVGECIMPKEGVFARVVEEATVSVGEAIRVVEEGSEA